MKRDNPSAVLSLTRVLCAALMFTLAVSGCEQPAGPGGPAVTPVVPPTAPEKPELMALDQSLGVNWKTVAGAESYTVYYGDTTSAENAQKWIGEITFGAGSASALVTGLTNGERYYVWISASNSAGESPKSESAYEKPAAVASLGPRLFFDYGWMIPSYAESERFYTVRQGTSLVLSPVRWKISEGATYAWTVTEGTGYSISGENSRYFTFSPSSTGNYRIQVTVNNNGTEYTAGTKVICTGQYTIRNGGGSPKALNVFGYMPAPGQFVGRYPVANFSAAATPENIRSTAQAVVSAAGSEWCFSLGAYGGYLITGFDHSVANTGGYELAIRGNAFDGWAEPGVVWVSRDDNGNGMPDDTWYELKGSRHGMDDAKQYAVTWLRPPGGGWTSAGMWMDNSGGMGIYPLGYPALSELEHITLTGTRVPRSGVSGGGAWGYVDMVGPGRFKISDAVQVNGSAANLDYIDFVKVQSASLEMTGLFGEISTETGVPYDLSMDNSAMRIQGALVTGGDNDGKYRYCFKNGGCGYTMTVTVEGETFELPSPAGERTIYLDSAEVYIDYYGGNVSHSNTVPGIITFGALPAEQG